MAKVRKDNKGRNLRPGETQRADGSYMYVYKLGTKKKYLYDSDLASLRVKEKQINKDKDDGIRTQEAMKLTLNDMFKVYMNNNIKLKPSTRANYLYLWDFYVKEEPFANMPLPQIHRSDILAFYTKLLKHGFAINSLESINTIVHPTLEMAVDDDYIRKNPSKGIYRKLKTDGSAPKPKRRIALTKTQQQNFLRFIAKSPTYSHLLGELAEKNLRLNEKLTHMGQRTTRAKLMSYFSAEALRRGVYEFDIPFSRQQLADYLGVERSGLSVELGKMRDEGLLDFHKSHFLLKTPEADRPFPSAR